MFNETDQKLIFKALNGSQGAWSKLVRRYETEVYNHALRMTHSEADAFDLLQEIFLAVFRNLPNFRGDSKFRTWLYRISSNRAIDFLRKKKHPESAKELEEIAGNEDPHRDLHLDQQNKMIHSLMKQLPAEQRILLELKFFQHFTFDEISAQLGISPNTVKTRLYSGLSKLKQHAENTYEATAFL
jgi:RNA polymerase sigma-70 factor (ECF subfamily)